MMDSNLKFLHISSGPTILEGSDAIEALSKVNDLKYLTPGVGVAAVSEERWRAAQEAEHLHWFFSDNKPKTLADDRNLEHFRRFNEYQAIGTEPFDRALEIGCGPFTNLRLIGGVSDVKSAVLLDPLISEYVQHVGNYFYSGALVTVPAWKVVAKLWPWVPRWARRLVGFIYGHIPIEKQIPLPAENLEDIHAYDLVVMINVLEHCKDASIVIGKALDALQPGGMFVFSDKLIPQESIATGLKRLYDVAHPIRLSREYVLSFLESHEILYESHYPDAAADFFPGAVESYFIIRKAA